jgi:hypothetical protein
MRPVAPTLAGARLLVQFRCCQYGANASIDALSSRHELVSSVAVCEDKELLHFYYSGFGFLYARVNDE